MLEQRDNPFNNFINEILNFNVEGMMTYAGQPMAEQDNGDEEQEYYEEAQAD